ncbi:hypothetical protein [Enterobacter cloacae]|nr:hypothetical protein [Enterobacter cloacae]
MQIKSIRVFFTMILIAVKMYRCERPSLNRIDENTFIYTWLKKAAKNNIFECALHDEIAWLRTQLRGHGIRSDVAKMVENIVVKLDFLLSVEEEGTT